MSVSESFRRQEAERAEREHREAMGSGPRFRDTDPRPPAANFAEHYRRFEEDTGRRPRGLGALIPGIERHSPSPSELEDERLIESLAALLVSEAPIYRDDPVGADECARRLIRAWRDGIDALIPTKPPIAKAEDERLIESLASHLAKSLNVGDHSDIDPSIYADVIREWRDGAR